MILERAPHVVFASLWLVWMGFVFVALGRPDSPLFGLCVLLAFLPIELVALVRKKPSRDTLSEIATWVIRHLSPHETPGRGWNAMLLMLILAVAYLLGRTVLHYSGAWFLAVAFGALTTVWLHDHFLSPQVHG
jgi:hypothetical protein